MKKLIVSLIASLTFTSLWAFDSSTNVLLPGSLVASGLIATSASPGDSTGVGHVANLQAQTSTANAGPSCPSGQEWGIPFGVSQCISPAQHCADEFLTWNGENGTANANAICQAYAPATASVKVQVTYQLKTGNAGGSVYASCTGMPIGACEEVYSLVAMTAPITIATTEVTSVSQGYAGALCVAGSWLITSSVCHAAALQ